MFGSLAVLLGVFLHAAPAAAFGLSAGIVAPQALRTSAFSSSAQAPAVPQVGLSFSCHLWRYVLLKWSDNCGLKISGLVLAGVEEAGWMVDDGKAGSVRPVHSDRGRN